MNKTVIQIMVLFALFFNIAHATIIAVEDSCHHETTHEYVLEQSQSNDCGDLCDMHHLFHFMAILDTPIFTIDNNFHQVKLTHKTARYTPPSKQTNIKPPIA